MSADFWLGVATLPALGFAFVAIIRAHGALVMWLDRRHGITFEMKMSRHVGRISEYRVRHDIWWERSWGPVFAGCWYRDDYYRHGKQSGPVATRWIGIGSTDGPCALAFRRRHIHEGDS